MSKLNEEQQKVVSLTRSPCLVIAGAGSGKTFTICQKIAHLALHPLYQKILAITFTNKAAKELSERLKKLNIPAKSFSVLTFHSFGLAIIQKYGHLIGIKKNFSLIDSQDKIELIKETNPSLKETELYELSESIAQIKHYAQHESIMCKVSPAFLIGWQRYEEALLQLNVIDLDDLVFKALKLTSIESVALELKSKYGYIFIDEYQDTNFSQYELFKNITHPDRFTVVGDDDQSIYTWRGANPANLQLIMKDFPQLEVIKMEENFRSSPEILNAANALIEKNTHLFEKKLWSAKSSNEKVLIKECPCSETEVEFILDDIQLQTDFRKNIAILFRTNFQSTLLEKALKERKIDYTLLGASSIFNKIEIKDLTCYLRVILNPDDDQAFKRILNTPKRGLGPQSISTLVSYADKYNLSLYHAMSQFRFLNEQPSKNQKTFHQLSLLIEKYREINSKAENLDWIDQLLTDIEYYEWIEQQNNKKSQIDKKKKGLKDFINWLKKLYLKNPELDSVLKKLIVIDLMDNAENMKDIRITLSTIHAVKGLEFHSVYVLGCLEGTLPHHQSEGNIQEERRLLYVAMTRAKEKLCLTYPLVMNGKGVSKSRFLEEIPEEYLKTAEEKTPGPQTWEELRAILGY